MTQLVTSPGGDQIEIIPDDEFMEVFDVPHADLRQWSRRSYAVRALWQHGAYTDKNGRATGMLVDDMRQLGYKASNSAFNSQLNSGGTMVHLIERDLNGKRTHRIQLVRLPEMYYRKLPTIHEAANAANTQQPRFLPEGIVVEYEPEPEPQSEFNSREVAEHLLALLIDKLNEPTPEPIQLEATPTQQDLSHRLAEQVEYGQRIREEARRLSTQLAKVTAERDQLAHEVQVTRARLEQGLSREARLDLDTQLRRLMEGKPSSKGE